jgi:hypothetical protein
MLIVGVVLLALFVQGLGLAVLFKAAPSHPHSQYSAAEQQFLAAVHEGKRNPVDPLDNQPWVAWDDDASPLREGYELCRIQDHPTEEFNAGWMPPDIQGHYANWQAIHLEVSADNYLCTRHRTGW